MDVAAQAVAVRAIVPPDGLLQRIAAHHIGTALHEDFEDFQAQRIEFEMPPAAADLEGIEVVGEIADLQGALAHALATAQHRLDARGQLGKSKGFQQVVIGAAAKALQAVIQRVAGSKHDHRRAAARFLAQALAQSKAVDSRQHDVQHQQIEMLAAGQLQTTETILSAVDGIALERQVIGQIGQDVAIVFDQQDTHAHLPQRGMQHTARGLALA